MKRKFLQDISINTLQLVIVQGCGLIIFYLLSIRLEKNEFGQINWALAVLMTAFGVLAFGIDQVAVRRIASGAAPARELSAYLVHVCITGILFYGILWTSSLFFPAFYTGRQALLLLGIGKLMIFVSTAFKQVATGMEKFRALLMMSVVSNMLRALLLIVLAAVAQLNFRIIILVFVITDFAELLVSFFVMRRVLKVPLTVKWEYSTYKNLISESLPQFGVSVFSAALARLDWIFLGVLAGNMILAEYSFAYKVFEMATLPLLVIAPVLIPRFTKYFHPEAAAITTTKLKDLYVLLRLEMIIASLVALLLNVAWGPLIDLLTGNKYGAVNQNTILLLSLSMPLLYFNNFLWTVNFARGRLKMIFYIFLTSFICNLAADIILIPFYNAAGAAVAYLIAIVVQSILYFKNTTLAGLTKNSYSLLICPLAAIAAYLAVHTLFDMLWLQVPAATLVYFLLLYFTGQLRFSDWLSFKRISEL